MRKAEGHEGSFGVETGGVVDLNDLGFKSRWGHRKTQTRLDATRSEIPRSSGPVTRTDESKDSPRLTDSQDLWRPGEKRGRAVICAAGVLTIAAILALPGCDSRPRFSFGAAGNRALEMQACRDMCEPFAVSGWMEHHVAPEARDLGSACVCANYLVDGGRP